MKVTLLSLDVEGETRFCIFRQGLAGLSLESAELKSLLCLPLIVVALDFILAKVPYPPQGVGEAQRVTLHEEVSIAYDGIIFLVVSLWWG